MSSSGTSPSDGWTESADAWIDSLGEGGDFGRRFVLDAPMMALAVEGAPADALDVGCGEGRFCRMLQARGVRTVGIDPTARLIDRAIALDPAGDYRIGRAEALDFPDASFDLVVSYLSLIDIPDAGAAIAEMARTLRPGGLLLIANLTSTNTAAQDGGWTTNAAGAPRFAIDHYLEERAEWVEWRGVRVRNWHRPLGAYMAHLLGAGLILIHFSEPEPTGGDPATAARYRRAPWFLVMAWRKP